MHGKSSFVFTSTLLLILLLVECNESKNVIKKCCPRGKHILKQRMECKTPNAKWRNRPIPNIPLYRFIPNNLPEVTEKNLTDLYEIQEPENLTFGDSWNDYQAIRHRIYLSDNATLIQIIPNEYEWLLQLDRYHFCVDLKLLGKETPPEIVFLSDLGITSSDYDPMIITIGFLVSTFFLALVLLVYCLLPELRNLSGLVLMAYVASLFGAFLLMAVLRLGTHVISVCYALSTMTYFLFMASFCWMNVMSLDIWWTFRGYAKARPIHRRGEMFKFGTYCLYGFGVPLSLTALMLTMDFVDLSDSPWIIIPGNTRKGCFMGDNGRYYYLYVPMLILILTNWLLFLMTAFNIWRLHRNTAVLDSAAAGTPAAHRKQRYRLLVYLKLSIIMGINWVLEVISSTYPDFKGWYITDAYNLLMGLFIFLIFVCKRKILRKIIRRIKGDNEWRWRRNVWESKSSKSASSGISASSHTTDSDLGADTPLQVCNHPKGPVTEKR